MRLFLAVEIPEALKKILGDIQEELKPKIKSKLTWVRPEQMHITLKFLGEVGEDAIPEILTSLSSIKIIPFSLRLQRLGGFPNARNPRVLWAGYEESQELKELHGRVDSAVSQWFEQEKHFKGHVTIARVKYIEESGSVAEILNAITLPPFTMDVSGITLFSSELKGDGPIYTLVATF